MRRLLSSVVFAVLAIVIGIGCGEGPQEERKEASPTPFPAITTTVVPTATEIPTVTPTPVDRATLEGLLRAMSLGLEDMPTGLTLEEEYFTTNEEQAEKAAEGREVALQNYERWGRVLGYDALYFKEISLSLLAAGALVGVRVGATWYENEEGAKQAIRYYSSQDYRDALAASRSDDAKAEARPMSFTKIGDETVAIQVKEELEEWPFVWQRILIRKGQAIGVLLVGAAQAPHSPEEVEALASKLEQRMGKALRGEIAPVTVTPSPDTTPTIATPTATPAVGGGVEVLNHRAHRSEYGSLSFYGEVKNQEDATVTRVNVVLTLFNEAGSIVGTGDGYADPRCLPQGETAVFSIYVSDPPDSWARENLQVQWSPMEEWYRDWCYKAFSVSGVSIAPREYGGLTVRGQVTNTGEEEASSVKVTFAAYDEANQVLAVDFTFVDIDPLAPEQSSPFEIPVMGLDTIPPSHRIVVEATVE